MARGVGFGLHCARMEPTLRPAELFAALSEDSGCAFLLESSERDERLARYSFVGFSPSKRITLNGSVMDVDGEQSEVSDPLKALKELRGTASAPAGRGFVGGALGYFSFDYIRQIERQRLGARAIPAGGAHFPDLEFGVFDDVVVFDHRTGSVSYIYRGKSRMDEIRRIARDRDGGDEALRAGPMRCRRTKAQFCKMVERAQEHIKAGDAIQVVLSRRYEARFSGSLLPFYLRLRSINPSPYMYCLRFGERQIVGSSPENLVRVEGRSVVSYATLAGTRPRGRTRSEDMRLERELLGDKKERAEHIMLVDLTRNDIGKVAEIGSVRVPRLMKVRKYSHVQHISSMVAARLRQGCDGFDAFRAIFPAGTVSGAPKVRAIEIIDSLERARRGPYAGAVGYFSSNGDADFAIAIRTLFSEGSKAHIQAGAGIVYDSVPESEFHETEHKAQALMEALKQSGKGSG